MESSTSRVLNLSSIAQGNATNETTTISYEVSWGTTLLAFEAINIAMIIIAVWVLLCMIVYGTKTRRWTNTAGTSSLNNGMIYVACTISVAATLPRFIATEVTYHKRQLETGLDWCELIGDLSTAAYGLSLFTMYIFLSLRQRLIYKHPFVKEKVSPCMNMFSKVFYVILLAVTIALMCFFIIPTSYFNKEYGCREEREENSSIVLACAFLVTQGMMLALCIYPAFRVSIEATDGVKYTVSRDYDNGVKEDNCEAAPATPDTESGCSRFLFSSVATSPVEMTIKRTIICSVLIVLTDIGAVITDTLAFDKNSPTSVRQTVTDIGSFLNIFFALATFGFAGKVLTLFFSACCKTKRSESAEKEQNAEAVSCDTQI